MTHQNFDKNCQISMPAMVDQASDLRKLIHTVSPVTEKADYKSRPLKKARIFYESRWSDAF